MMTVSQWQLREACAAVVTHVPHAPPTGVTIGFEPTEYSVDEEARVVTFVVKVLAGSLMRSVEVEFSTSDGNAIGRT